MKHFGCESSNVQPSFCLDVVVYMLNCVFWWHIPLEIEFKVVAQTMHSGITHERCADFRHAKKKQKRDEFITPPRPTGRRSNNRHLIIFFAFFVSIGSTGSAMGYRVLPLDHYKTKSGVVFHMS